MLDNAVEAHPGLRVSRTLKFSLRKTPKKIIVHLTAGEVQTSDLWISNPTLYQPVLLFLLFVLTGYCTAFHMIDFLPLCLLVMVIDSGGGEAGDLVWATLQ